MGPFPTPKAVRAAGLGVGCTDQNGERKSKGQGLRFHCGGARGHEKVREVSPTPNAGPLRGAERARAVDLRVGPERLLAWPQVTPPNPLTQSYYLLAEPFG
jgi:hypothetical protein